MLPDEDFFELSKKGEPRRDKALSGRLFMVFLNQDALGQMLSLWNAWQEGGKFRRRQGPWKAVFRQLHDVRVWGVKDRLHETGVLTDWRARVARGEEVVPCEVELWHRGTVRQRRDAQDRVAGLVRDRGGRVITEVAIEEIAYHALLVHLPVAFVDSLLDGDDSNIALVQCEQIQFFRASGQMAVTLLDDGHEEDQEALPGQPAVGTPVVALFDGLPLQGHRRLDGRLVIDDPDNVEEGYPATRRRHGTAMASLIVHGDLAARGTPLSRPLYVRPILRPDSRNWHNNDEVVAENTLVVDLLHRAVRRMYEGEGREPAAAPSVAVINLSIGVRDRPFDQSLSPLARLLDWLAWRYKVLFVVSAGNHPQRIGLENRLDDVNSMPADEMQRAVIRSVASDGRNRRLLSPAEAVNALTVAAVHEDASSAPPPPRWRDPYHGSELPSPINAQGMGYRRAIKPDLLASGGRVVVQEPAESRQGAESDLDIYGGTLAPGQLVAAPAATAGEKAGTRHARGTSNAAALVSRAAGALYEVLEELRGDSGGEMIEGVPRAVWLKALVSHGADWRVAGDAIGAILDGQGTGRQVKGYVTRLLGYGAVEVERVRECTESRVTAIGAGSLEEDSSHVHRYPLPSITKRVEGLPPAHHHSCVDFAGESKTSELASGATLVLPSEEGT